VGQDDHLRRMPDLARLAKRCQRGVATLADVVRLYQVVLRLPALAATVTGGAGALRTTFGGPLEVRALLGSLSPPRCA
jgi:DNA mismatch repair ATPase MutS